MNWSLLARLSQVSSMTPGAISAAVVMAHTEKCSPATLALLRILCSSDDFRIYRCRRPKCLQYLFLSYEPIGVFDQVA